MKNTINKNIKLSIIYTHSPHYRFPIFKTLLKQFGDKITFFYDKNGIDSSIKSSDCLNNSIHIKSIIFKRFILQPGFLKYSLFSDSYIYIFLGNPYILSTILYSIILRIRKKKIIFWTHGWIKKENRLKLFFRNNFYRLADYLLLYDKRSKEIGKSYNFAPNKLIVFYNSLDYQNQKSIYLKLEKIKRKKIKTPYFLIISRLVKETKIDQAIKALNLLLRNNKKVKAKLIIIGNGNEFDYLNSLVKELNIDVVFKKAIYNEKVLANYIYNSISIISPGKIGLLALHALVYGKSVITHSDYNYQMPEFEALLETKKCYLFKRNDIESCSKAMLKSIKQPKNLKYNSQIFEKKYSPEAQSKILKNLIKRIK